MSPADTITRRGAAHKRTQNGHSNGNGAMLSLEVVEAGLASWDDSKSSNGHHASRRRRKSRKGSVSLSVSLRRMLLFFRRSPNALYTCVAASLAIAILAYIAVSVVLHKNIEPPTPDPIMPRYHDHVPEDTHHSPNQRQNKPPAIFPKNTDTGEHKFAALDIIFQGIKSASKITFPQKLGMEEFDEAFYFDFGNLKINFFEEDGASRQVFHDSKFSETDFRSAETSKDDDVDMYYAFDDDYLRSSFTAVDSEDEPAGDKLCRRTSQHRLNYQNCNTFHESGLLESNVKYLSAGAYRQVMALDNDYSNKTEKIVIKDIHYSYETSDEYVEYVKNDALVAERLSSSPRIYDIYGFCGLGIMSEFFPHGDMEDVAVPGKGYMTAKQLHDGYDVKPQNKLTGLQKLEISTQMAEALADLHGNTDGVIVHQDMQLAQYLWNSDKSMVKLNDFNRAEFMLWDEEHQEYCRYHEGPGNGNWRSPEEYYDKPLNEQVDVFAFGNNMYSLLTGLWPFYDEDDEEDMQGRVKKGDTAYIDPRYKKRSIAERWLAEIIEKCYAYEPDNRPSIFEVVAMLRKGLKEAREENP